MVVCQVPKGRIVNDDNCAVKKRPKGSQQCNTNSCSSDRPDRTTHSSVPYWSKGPWTKVCFMHKNSNLYQQRKSPEIFVIGQGTYLILSRSFISPDIRPGYTGIRHVIIPLYFFIPVHDNSKILSVFIQSRQPCAFWPGEEHYF